MKVIKILQHFGRNNVKNVSEWVIDMYTGFPAKKKIREVKWKVRNSNEFNVSSL